MPTVIDALIITLGLDASGYRKGQKEAEQAINRTNEAAEKSNKKLTQSAKDAERTFNDLKRQVLGVAAALFGASAVKTFTERITSADANVGRLSKNIGMSTAELTAWQGAAAKAGGSAEGVSGSIKGIVSDIETFKLTGQSSLIPVLRAVGIEAVDSTGKIKDMSALLLEMSDKLSGKSAPEAQALGRQLGLDEGTVNLLMQGRTAVQAALEEQKKLNVVNEQDAKLAQQRQKALSDVKDQMEDIGRKALNDVTPALTKLAQALKDMLSFAQEHGAETNMVVQGLVVGLTALSAIKFTGLIAALAGVGGALASVGALAGAAATAVGVVVAVGTGAAVAKKVGAYAKPAIDKAVSKAAGYDATLGSVIADKFRKDEETKALGQMVYKITPKKKQGEPSAPGAGDTNGGKMSLGAAILSKLIAKGEGGYNSVNLGKRGGYKSGKADLENMTVAEVMAAQQDRTFNTVGRYQMSRDTLPLAVKALGLKGDEKFDKATQDKLFEQYLIKHKREAIGDYISGKSNNLQSALMGLALEWASFTDPTTGKSRYAGVANNKAHISTGEATNALNAARSASMSSSKVVNEVKIGQISITVPNGDGPAIASSVGRAIENNLLAVNANTGVVY